MLNYFMCAQNVIFMTELIARIFLVLFDDGIYKEKFLNIQSDDSLEFKDTKKYEQRLSEAKQKSGLDEAISVGVGKLLDKTILIACMNFNFIGVQLEQQLVKKFQNQ